MLHLFMYFHGMQYRLLLICLSLSFLSYAQPGYGFFYTNFGSEGDDIANRVIQSRSGHYFVIGSTTQSSFGQTDFVLVKHDSIHHYQWEKIYGGFFADIGKDIVELSDSGFVLAGYSNSYGSGGYDGLFYRVDKLGDIVWTKSVGSSDWDFINKIHLVGDSLLIACGYKEDKTNKKQGWIICMDLNGNVRWQKVIGGTQDDQLNGLTLTTDNRLVFIGTTTSYNDLNGDIWLPVFNINGDSLTTKFFGGNKKEVGQSIYQEKNKDIVFCGGSESFTTGKLDAYMVRTDSAFLQVWQMNYGQSSQDEIAWDIKPARSNYGSMLVCYSTRESVAFGLDAKALLLNPSGYYIDGGRIGSYGEEEVFSIVSCKDKGYVLAGYTTSYNAKMKDFYLLQFDSLVHGTGTIVLSNSEIANDTQAELYPMPFREKFYLNNSNGEVIEIAIWDLEGRQINFNYNPLSSEISGDFAPGLYFLSVKGKDKVIYRKIIKE